MKNPGLPMLLIFSVLLALCASGAAQGAELRGIRIGAYGDKTRLVFDFSGPVDHEKPVQNEQGHVTVLFLNTAESPSLLIEKTKKVKRIDTARQGSHLSAEIHPVNPDFRFKYFNLYNPRRFVLDLYPLNESSGVSQEKPAAARTEAAPQSTPPARNGEEKLPFTGEQTDFSGREIAARRSESHVGSAISNHDHLEIFLLSIILFVLIVILLLIVFMLIPGKVRPKKGHAGGGFILDPETNENIAEIDKQILAQLKKHQTLRPSETP
jgi:hypothetical protein